MNYGYPYMGSKNRIAEWVLEQLPEAENLYDLFGGGGAITHCAAISGKYKKIYYNDIQDGITKLFKDAMDGKYKNETRWINPEDFYNLKDTDPFVRQCWSFGNNQSSYMYSNEIMYWKKAYHYAVIFNDYSLFNEMNINIKSDKTETNKRRLDISRQIKQNNKEYKSKYINWYLKNILKLDGETIEKIKHTTYEDKDKEKQRLQKILIDALNKSGLKKSDINKLTNTEMANHWFTNSQWQFPTKEMYDILCTVLDLPEYYSTINYYNLLNQNLGRLERLQSLECLQRLERLQSLECLQRLERFQSLENINSEIIFSQLSYDEIEINPNSIIYCDIPYRNTAKYNIDDFDYDKFYEWACKQTVPVYISEYSMPEDKFVCIAEREKNVLLSATSTGKAIEKIFIPKK